jgi:hypothetical protein
MLPLLTCDVSNIIVDILSLVVSAFVLNQFGVDWLFSMPCM